MKTVFKAFSMMALCFAFLAEASVELPDRFRDQHAEMTEVMGLDQERSDKLLELMTIRHEGRMNARAFEGEERKAVNRESVQAYNKALEELVSKKDLRNWKKHQREKKNN